MAISSSQVSVAVIGSARLVSPDPRWSQAEELGRQIASRGWITVTGGYGGLMAAVSSGAASAGGVVVGLPMSGWTSLRPNQWNHSLRWSASYPQRLAHILAADAIIALDGGIGTLSEAAVAWAALQTESRAAPLVFLGAGWPLLLDAIAAHLVVDADDLGVVTVCSTAAEAASQIAAHIAAARDRPLSQPRGLPARPTHPICHPWNQFKTISLTRMVPLRRTVHREEQASPPS